MSLMGAGSTVYGMHLEHGAYAHATFMANRVKEITTEREPASQWTCPDPWDPDTPWLLSSPPRRLWVIHDAMVHVPSGSILVCDLEYNHARVVGVVAGSQPQMIEDVHLGRLRSRVRSGGHLGGLILPIAQMSNYWHWTVEVLPMLVRASRYGERVGQSVTVLVSEDLNSWQRDCLGFLGLTWRLSNKEFLPVERALLLSRPGILPFSNLDAAQLRRFREVVHVPIDVKLKNGSKVMISRAGSRRFTDDLRIVEEVLAARGWQVLRTEELTLEQEVSSLSQARVVVGANGAGLVNMAWMPPGSHVIELAYSAFWHATTPNLAYVLGHRYDLVVMDYSNPMAIVSEVERLADAI